MIVIARATRVKKNLTQTSTRNGEGVETPSPPSLTYCYYLELTVNNNSQEPLPQDAERKQASFRQNKLPCLIQPQSCHPRTVKPTAAKKKNGFMYNPNSSRTQYLPHSVLHRYGQTRNLTYEKPKRKITSKSSDTCNTHSLSATRMFYNYLRRSYKLTGLQESDLDMQIISKSKVPANRIHPSTATWVNENLFTSVPLIH